MTTVPVFVRLAKSASAVVPLVKVNVNVVSTSTTSDSVIGNVISLVPVTGSTILASAIVIVAASSLVIVPVPTFSAVDAVTLVLSGVPRVSVNVSLASTVVSPLTEMLGPAADVDPAGIVTFTVVVGAVAKSF